jgi:hypothetical protein
LALYIIVAKTRASIPSKSHSSRASFALLATLSSSALAAMESCSAIEIKLPLHLGGQFNHSPDCFSTGRDVGLAAPPVVDGSQKIL